MFAQHNLVSDRSFNEFHVIVCRNVMIYFDRTLQERVHALFYDSLVTLGVLGLGRRESAAFTSFGDRYEPIDTDERSTGRWPELHLVVVGASWGGMESLAHASAGAAGRARDRRRGRAAPPRRLRPRALQRALQRRSPFQVADAEDKEPIEAGRVYLAPADYHLLVEPGRFALSTEEAVNYSRPSIDVLFESAADAYGERTIGIVLTGADRDGVAGLTRVKERGGAAIVAGPRERGPRARCRSAAVAAEPDAVLPLEEIAAVRPQPRADQVAA